MKNLAYSLIISTLLLGACQTQNQKFDATGNFEATEIVVSAESTGKILAFNAEEGQTIPKDCLVVVIDEKNLDLQKAQIEASMRALEEKTADVNPQIQLLREQMGVQQTQLKYLQQEKNRVENLLKSDAATPKQLDDLKNQIALTEQQIAVLQQQMRVQETAVQTQNRGILSEQNPLKVRVEQVQDQLNRTRIRNPLQGTILAKYAEAGEITAYGKALYKIADLSNLTLRAYISGAQLSQVKLGQTVKVLVDEGKDNYKEYQGVISWVSSQSEFTPKTIQTKDERANLVYAIKIRVKNDGYLKIGMYGEVNF